MITGGGGTEGPEFCRRRAELRDCAYPEDPVSELESDLRFVRIRPDWAKLWYEKGSFPAECAPGTRIVKNLSPVHHLDVKVQAVELEADGRSHSG